MEEYINNRIVKWWRSLPDPLRTDLPTFVHKFNKEIDLLFIGFNPAGGGKSVIEKNTEISAEKIINIANEEKEHIFGADTISKKGQYKIYYGIFNILQKEYKEQYNTSINWEYYDLFHMKQSKSKLVESEIYFQKSNLKPLYEEHVSLVRKIIKFTSPKIVITNNVNTAKILNKYLPLEFDQTLGLHKLKVDDNFSVYFYLSGTMQYGRSTEFDRKRILWHINKILNI